VGPLTETNITKTKKSQLQLKFINSWYLDAANYLPNPPNIAFCLENNNVGIVQKQSSCSPIVRPSMLPVFKIPDWALW